MLCIKNAVKCCSLHQNSLRNETKSALRLIKPFTLMFYLQFCGFFTSKHSVKIQFGSLRRGAAVQFDVIISNFAKIDANMGSNQIQQDPNSPFMLIRMYRLRELHRKKIGNEMSQMKRRRTEKQQAWSL